MKNKIKIKITLTGIGILMIVGIVLISGCVEEKSTNCSAITNNFTGCAISCDTNSDCKRTCCGCINKNENCQTESNGMIVNCLLIAGECKCVNRKCEFFEEKLGESFCINYYFTSEGSYEKVEINQSKLTYTYFEDVDKKCEFWTKQTPCCTEGDLKTMEVTLSEDEINDLINLINQTNFMNLEDTYGGADQGRRYYSHRLFVKIDDNEKEVIYQSFPGASPMPEAFKKVKDKLFELINEKFRNQTQITKEQAIAIANATEEVQEFLKLYPDAQLDVKHTIDEYMACCSGCPPSIWEVYPGVILMGSMTRFCSNWEECFSSKPAKCNEDIWGVIYYYPNDNTSEKITVQVILDGTNGEILAKHPKLEYIKKFNYCKQDEHCITPKDKHGYSCECTNFIQPVPMWMSCRRDTELTCKCVNNTCITTTNE